RAKVAAVAKAREDRELLLARARERDAALVAARAVEWERRRKALEARLLRENQDVVTELEAADARLREVEEKAKTGQAKIQGVGRRLEAGRDAPARLQAGLLGRRAAVEEAGKQNEATRAERERLTLQLVSLERTLESLKAARKLEQRTYSLVPYH